MISALIFQGYRLVPGDKCKGGFTPSRHLETVKKSCAQVSFELCVRGRFFMFFYTFLRVYLKNEVETILLRNLDFPLINFHLL